MLLFSRFEEPYNLSSDLLLIKVNSSHELVQKTLIRKNKDIWPTI